MSQKYQMDCPTDEIDRVAFVGSIVTISLIALAGVFTQAVTKKDQQPQQKMVAPAATPPAPSAPTR